MTSTDRKQITRGTIFLLLSILGAVSIFGLFGVEEFVGITVSLGLVVLCIPPIIAYQSVGARHPILLLSLATFIALTPILILTALLINPI